MPTTKAQSIDVTSNTGAISDESVIEQILIGNTNAFEIIMRRYNQRLYRIARSILINNDAAEDAVQQAYISAYFKLDSYIPSGSFGAWLTRITINEALMIKRKPDNRYAETKDIIDDDKIASTQSDPMSVQTNKELGGLIEAAVDKLPAEFRHVFILRAIQQLSTRETAESLAIDETTVKTRLHRARNMMQQTLNQHIAKAGLHVHEFAGQRCDNMVKAVLEVLHSQPKYTKAKTSLH